MRVIKIIGSSVFQIFSFIFVLAYLLGILNVHFSDKNDYCLMTFMFEYPQFVRITVPENSNYPQYGLFAYSEGRFTERARKMWFDGVPVLFLPGNSGSHMQARSVASVALRKALSRGSDYHFDFFTISYNEELSGLYGGVLDSQTRFAAACVSKILSLYKSNKYTKSIPTSVVLIGHSMGGVIAKRLLAYPSTIKTTNIAITLASPLEAPVINFDVIMNNFYMVMDLEWEAFVNRDEEMKQKKVLISFGSGPRDVLMPSGLTSSNETNVGGLTTAIPGVWVSPDHVSMVWCKQLVMAINRYLFSIVDPSTEQVIEDPEVLKPMARLYFQANRSNTLSPDSSRLNATMLADAFWYEDNRRIYQISRPEIDKTTYLMIRLVTFPQNRFVAIEAVNLDDKDWIYGCNAKFSYNTYRYCKDATSLNELSRWTGAAMDFGKRKLATINLHNLIDLYPDWSHVIVKISPTRKPIVLNVDINDYASREITVNLPSELSFGKSTIKQETEAGSLYYELVLPGFTAVHQAYLLYIEPTPSCKATQYHVSAEMHVPWAKNHESYHYFTHLKRSPMKLRLFKSNPNVTLGLDPTEHVRVTVLLDPQCQYTISISSSWYYRLAQLVRNYTPILVPYIAAIVLLAARSNLLSMRDNGTCMSIHGALMSEGVKPYYALVFCRLGTMIFMSVPFLVFLFENASYKNMELLLFSRSLMVLPVYMTALGLLNIAAAAILGIMVFSSQLAHRLLFRIFWRGGPGLAEKLASGLQKVPMIVSAALICAAPLSCGAASLAAGAAFYAFMLSKMYEEYLEDYVYKLMAKFASKLCRFFTKNKKPKEEIETSLITKNDSSETLGSNEISSTADIRNKSNTKTETDSDDKEKVDDKTAVVCKSSDIDNKNVEWKRLRRRKSSKEGDVDEELNNLNFHMMLFFMWISVTLLNMPALLTWARNFKYSIVLKPDTSYHTGLVMSVCSSFVWQMDGPRRNLRYYEAVSSLLFTMAIFVLAIGPQFLSFVNYGMTFMFTVITIQQLWDKDDLVNDENKAAPENEPKEDSKAEPENVASKQNADNTGSDKKETESSAAAARSSDRNNDNVASKQSGDNTASNKNEADGSAAAACSSDRVKENVASKQSGDNTTSDKNEAESSGAAACSSEPDKNECDVCNESRIYNIFKNLREKFSFNEDL